MATGLTNKTYIHFTSHISNTITYTDISNTIKQGLFEFGIITQPGIKKKYWVCVSEIVHYLTLGTVDNYNS